jgi:tRNA threonylcarbamoyladenosine biosynthesis protein TsaB
MNGPGLILETSGRVGRVGVAVNGVVAAETLLDETRRHARDLAPAVSDVLARTGVTPKDVRTVAVSVGPGSFTGLRVGIASAKAFAYATGCDLVAVPTFEAIAWQSPPECESVDVISDGLRGTVYTQRFRRISTGWAPVHELVIVSLTEWRGEVCETGWVSGPGVVTYDAEIPSYVRRVPEPLRLPSVTAVLAVAKAKPWLSPSERDALEPLYLRGSSAEEKAKAEGRNGISSS